jgi:hypothetical protein
MPNPHIDAPDGLTVSMDPEVVERLRVKLASVPRAEFLGEDAPKELEEAKTALPPYLSVKSPYYTIDVKGNVTGPAALSMVIPMRRNPGKRWTFMPGMELPGSGFRVLSIVRKSCLFLRWIHYPALWLSCRPVWSSKQSWPRMMICPRLRSMAL